MSSPKVNRSKAREAALQVLFCQQFTDRDMSVATTSVEATQTIRDLQEAMARLNELTKAATDAAKSLEKVIAVLAQAGTKNDKAPKPPTEGTLSTRLPVQRARTAALESLKAAGNVLRDQGALFDEAGFCSRLLSTYDKNRNKVDSVLTRSLEGWTVRRLTAEDHANLSLGITELLFFTDVPPRVTINEYIELAKRYGDNDSPRLINGVLDRVAKDNPRESAKG